jgi:hypothetical protein
LHSLVLWWCEALQLLYGQQQLVLAYTWARLRTHGWQQAFTIHFCNHAFSTSTEPRTWLVWHADLKQRHSKLRSLLYLCFRSAGICRDHIVSSKENLFVFLFIIVVERKTRKGIASALNECSHGNKETKDVVGSSQHDIYQFQSILLTN